jgi:hypothetical protein
MKKMSFTYLMFATLSAAIAAFYFYTMFMVINEQPDKGAWLFATMGILFSILPAFALIRVLAEWSEFFARIYKSISPKPAESENTRFGPHWMLMLGMIVFALLIISVVIDVIKNLFS